MYDHTKYSAFQPVHLPDRQWPNNTLTQAPSWCSVDLRDGNQALVNPMSVLQKTQLFKLLVAIGFKEIEVGFPSASKPDFDFVRKIITEGLVPDDVTLQVLTQAREALIERTYEALEGCKKAVIHVYNSTSAVQREQVFGQDKGGIKSIAVQGAKWVQEYAEQHPNTAWAFQYSPESFTGTELDYAVEVCDAVLEVWQPENGREVIINLPATVEMSTPNVFADQIEYFCRHLNRRSHVRISLHTHNDRGCGVAACELGLLAGADRVEGTLMGNGERTGNTDIVTMAMNLYSQGVDPKLDFSDILNVIEVVEACTEIPVGPRHPWAGELVYTAFSGSHQDAIRKSLKYHADRNKLKWDVAYLPIDPRDIGREYEAVVRINSQSGKGGVALVLERDYGIELPKWMHMPLSFVVQDATESTGMEISPQNIHDLYQENFVMVDSHWTLQNYIMTNTDNMVTGQFKFADQTIEGTGHGALEALSSALQQAFGCQLEVSQYDQHALMNAGTESMAQACIEVSVNSDFYAAVSVAEDTTQATLQAMLTAFSRSPVSAQSVAQSA